MKKILAGLVLGGGSLFAGPHISVGIGVGVPVAPAPVYAVPPMPAPGYAWVDGYYYYAGGHRLWHDGYWRAPVEHGHFDRGFRR